MFERKKQGNKRPPVQKNENAMHPYHSQAVPNLGPIPRLPPSVPLCTLTQTSIWKQLDVASKQRRRHHHHHHHHHRQQEFEQDVGVGDDPHMIGFHGQNVDWRGEDGGWYVLISEADTQMSVRLTAPLPEDFPDRQLVTGLSIIYGDGHSLVIETKNPYTTGTAGCPDDWFTPCLSEGTLRITVDSKEQEAVPTIRGELPGVGAYLTAINLPAECQPYGGDIIWANKAERMEAHRGLAADTAASGLTDIAGFDLARWISTWSSSVAAPSWCNKFMEEAGVIGALSYHSRHTVFSIETPALALRLHHGTNHQGGEVRAT